MQDDTIANVDWQRTGPSATEAFSSEACGPGHRETCFAWRTCSTLWLERREIIANLCPRLSVVDRYCLQGLPPRVKIGVRFFRCCGHVTRTCRWAGSRSHFILLKSAAAGASKQYQEQTASLQTTLLPETYRASHDMSRPGEPYLKTGKQALSDAPRAVMTRQQNRRVLLPFGPTSSCYRVEQ